MDQSTFVENQIDDGRRFVERFAADGHPVQAAFWVKTAEEGLWFLYLATAIVDQAGPSAAYRAVQSSLQKLEGTSLSMAEVKVVSPNNPIARDILAVMARYPEQLATRFGGKTLRSMAVEQTYIYPSHVFSLAQANPMTREDVGREILRLMNRGPGILQPSRVVLRDGSSFDGVPFAFQFGNQREVVVQFVADKEAAPRVVRLDDIASIT